MSEQFWVCLNLNMAAPEALARTFTKPVSAFTKAGLARSIPILRRTRGLYERGFRRLPKGLMFLTRPLLSGLGYFQSTSKGNERFAQVGREPGQVAFRRLSRERPFRVLHACSPRSETLWPQDVARRGLAFPSHRGPSSVGFASSRTRRKTNVLQGPRLAVAA